MGYKSYEPAVGTQGPYKHQPRGNSDLLKQLMTDFTLHMVWFVREKTKDLSMTVDISSNLHTLSI
eukprot:5722255-Amphidinium_carterae.1